MMAVTQNSKSKSQEPRGPLTSFPPYLNACKKMKIHKHRICKKKKKKLCKLVTVKCDIHVCTHRRATRK